MASGRVAAVLAAGVLVGTLAPRVEAQAAAFRRGDADQDGALTITDAIFVLNFLFAGGRAPPCTAVANSNGDPNLNITDPVFLLGHLFTGTAAPPPLTDDETIACKGLDPAAVARGMIIYQTRDTDRFSNEFSCALCHVANPETETDILRPGHTLLNALGRPRYKQEGRADFLGATNVCRVDWMFANPWAADNPSFADLVAFLKSLETEETSPALAIEIVAPARTGPSGGDGQAGCRLFNRSCAICHGENATGTRLAPSLVTVLPVPDLIDDPDYIRCRIRMSGPHDPTPYRYPDACEGPGGSISRGTVMPFWAADKLSDTEVEDLVAYLALSRRTARDTGEPLDCAGGGPVEGNVIRAGQFAGRFHGVAGTVEELDTRKIRLRDFNYDGGGIVVRVWLYKEGDIRNGHAIGPDLFRPGQPYVGVTLVLDVPAEITPEMYDHVSIWCLTARQDFGSARLEAAR
jgi:mono/diheme cytochrome c family protein